MLVRGISLISMREYVKTRLQGDKLKQFFTPFPDGEPDIIFSANKGQWYPFHIQRHMREQAASQFDPSNPRQAVMDMVAFTSDYEISSFLKGIIGILPPHMVLKNSAQVFGKFYQPGNMTALKADDKFSIIELVDFPADPLFCPVIDAWIMSAGRNMGLETEVTETSCIHRGDATCRWEVRWR